MTERPPSLARRRSAARLAAVQALYQIDLAAAPADAVLRDFLQHRIGGRAEQQVDEDSPPVELPLVEPDGELFTALVRGAIAGREDLDRMIGASLARDWTVERLETVLRAILRAGAYELTARLDVPARVAISEYVDVAHAFYAGQEPGLVNAVLDRIARVVRADELSGDGHAGHG